MIISKMITRRPLRVHNTTEGFPVKEPKDPKEREREERAMLIGELRQLLHELHRKDMPNKEVAGRLYDMADHLRGFVPPAKEIRQ